MLKNIPRGQIIRFRCNCTKDDEFILQSQVLKHGLWKRGTQHIKLIKSYSIFSLYQENTGRKELISGLVKKKDQ